jgi:hypothetical protein
LFELLDSLVAEGQKVLVFSQFVTDASNFSRPSAAPARSHASAHGPNQEPPGGGECFPGRSESGSVSYSVCGRQAPGLILTTASYVVLYDPWWNPAVEAQAIDRSHRIGQTQTVNAYRLISPGTVEEKIWELQQSKSANDSGRAWRGRFREEFVQLGFRVLVCRRLVEAFGVLFSPH